MAILSLLVVKIGPVEPVTRPLSGLVHANPCSVQEEQLKPPMNTDEPR
jgi:hypothetical protein